MCKLKQYGNCDTETENDEYCIFHKPNKTGEEARIFWEKFLEKFNPEKIEVSTIINERKGEKYVFKEKLNFKGFVFPKIPENIKFHFSLAEFEKDVDFSECVFEGDTDFSGATFKGSVIFANTTFKRNTFFIFTTFERNVYFDSSCFLNTALFSNALFRANASFFRCEFKKDAMFTLSYFKSGRFEENIFEGKMEFINSFLESFTYTNNIAKDKVEFAFSEFKNDSDFSNSFFKNKTRFDYVVFNGIAIFKKTVFKKFVSFASSEVKRVIDFSETVFEDDVIFPSYINDIRINPSPKYFKNPLAESKAWRVLRRYYERLGEDELADVNFLFERRALRKYRVWNAKKLGEITGKKNFLGLGIAYLSNFLEFLIAEETCSYGTSWTQAIYNWLVNVLVIFPILYALVGGISGAHSIWDYLYFSIVTATTLGYGDMHPIGYARIFASIEAIFGMFMWAVFLAVFVRKYMR